MMMMMKFHDDDDGDGDNDDERLWWWLLSSDESYISQRSDVLWRFACGDVFVSLHFQVKLELYVELTIISMTAKMTNKTE